MPILQVTSDSNRQLQNIANALAAAKKVVVFTGAGISTNCGIPVSSTLSYLYPSQLITLNRTSAQRMASTRSYKPNAMQYP